MALSQIQLLYQVSPIVLTGGIASNISGGMLPLLSLTSPNAFTTDMLSGSSTFELDDAFAIFQPAAEGSLVQQIIATYPYANLNVAANAVIRNPINLSMIMFTPMKQIGSWAVKQQIMTSLKYTLDSHNNAGGTYTVFTPAFVYTDMLMVNLIDCSIAQSPIPQNAWRWDFNRPLVSLADASGSMNNLMNQISNGTQPTGGGDPTTTGPGTAIGQPASVVNTGQGIDVGSPWISQQLYSGNPSGISVQSADWNTAFPSANTLPTNDPLGWSVAPGGTF
jgi:hypothetical protein